MIGRVGVPLLVLLAGCAYYNGLYNANRLADDARRAEREGRIGEARSLWSRAAVKAESVATRFPESKWHDDALLLQGRALYHIAACTRATSPLALAADSSPDRAIRREAGLTLARCRLRMAEPDSVPPLVDPIIGGADASARAQAYLLRGQARLALGDLEGALRDLDSSGVREASFPRAVALARLGRTVEAGSALDPQRGGGRYQEDAWLATLDTVGSLDPAAVAEVVESLGGRKDLTPGQRARLFLEDGERWLGVDRARALDRFAAAAAVAPDSTEGRAARAHLAVERAGQVTTVDEVPALMDTLRNAMQLGGEAAQVGGQHARILQRVLQALTPRSGPIQLFIAAEDVRDTLHATPLATALFLEVARRDSGDVLPPKALLAAAALDTHRADSLVSVVRTRFANSVYALALTGEAGDRYRTVEDSLRGAFAAAGRIRPEEVADDEELADPNRRRVRGQNNRRIRQ